MKMTYGTLPGVEKPVSRLVQGTTMISSRELDYSMTLLDDALDLGYTTFDTAHVYGSGDNERTFGRWLADRNVRDRVVLIGKGSHHNADRKRVTPFDITADIHDSLARFKIDFIDIYLLHRDDPSVSVGPIVETLNEHHRAGKIGAFGGSNWTVDRVREANSYAAQHGLKPFAASSPNYSLAEQINEPWPDCITISGPENEAARSWYQDNQMALFTWSSLAGGFFTGRFAADNLDTFDSYWDKLVVESYCYPNNFTRLERVKALAQQKDASIPQIALAFILSQPLNVFALVAPRNRAECEDNIAALNLKLTPEELDWLDLKRDSL